MSNFPGRSNKLTKLGQSLSRAFLKHGCVDKGWLVALFALFKGAFSEKDFIVLFPTVDFVAIESVCSLEELDFLANFLSKGFACCCSSVKTGFWEITFFWIYSLSSNNAIYSMPLCCTSGSQCSLHKWQIIWTSDFKSSYFTANFAKAFSIMALLLLLAVWKCLLITS